MSTFQKLESEFLAYFTEDSNHRASLGINRDLDRLPDNSLAFKKAHKKRGLALLHQFQSLNLQPLNHEQQLDVDVAILKLEAELFKPVYNGLTDREQMPDAAEAISSGTLCLMTQDSRPSQQRLKDIFGRIKDIPRYLSEEITHLTVPVDRWV